MFARQVEEGKSFGKKLETLFNRWANIASKYHIKDVEGKTAAVQFHIEDPNR